MNLPKISRREFLIAAGCAAGGGLLLLLDVKDMQGALKAFMGETIEEVELNSWVLVSEDNSITIRIAQMEMGQGTITSMAQIMAEELDAEWSTIKTEFISVKRHFLENKLYGRTETAASWGVSSSIKRLRYAGAQIKAMLLAAAAKRLDVDLTELSSKNSFVIHAATGRKLSYGDLATDAAKQPVPDPSGIMLKSSHEYQLIGKSIPRLELPSTTDGKAVYGTDFNIEGMKYAAVAIFAKTADAFRVKNIENIKSRPGVYKLIELPQAVVVVADSWWIADMALKALSPELPDVSGDFSSDNIKSRLLDSLDVAPQTILRQDGDWLIAERDAKNVVEAIYFTPHLEHAAMEPISCTALVNDGSFELWVGTQVPEKALEDVARILGLPPSSGEIHLLRMGGSFGRRLETDFIVQAVEIARQMPGIPVKLIWSRETTMRNGFYRPAHLARIRGSLDPLGQLQAMSMRLVATAEGQSQAILGAATFLYSIPKVLVDFVSIKTSLRDGSMRGVAYTANCFFIQSFMDECARASSKNSYLYLLQHLNPRATPLTLPESPDKNPYLEAVPPRERMSRLKRVLNEVAQRADWWAPLDAMRGRGIAIHEEANAYYAVVVEVTLDGRGWFSVDRVIIAADPGQLVNPNNAEAQLQGSVAFGLTSAMYGEITTKGGIVEQSNFHDYKLLRCNEMPTIDIHWVLSEQYGYGGVAEAMTAAIVPALTNALYDAGGPRIRSLPIKNHQILPRQRG